MSGETCFEIDFNFSDILSKIDDCSSIPDVKRAKCNDNLNSFDLSFIDISCNDLSKNSEYGDLSALLETCQVSNGQPSDVISLSALANHHFSENLLKSKPEKCPPSPVLFSLKDIVSDENDSFDCLEDILNGGKFEGERLSSTDSLLSSLDSGLSSENSSSKSKENNGFGLNNENDLNELMPDINLSFCVKKNSNKEDVSPFSSSPISSDSGFDEIDCSSKEILNSSDGAPSTENLFEKDYVPSALTATKPSLLAKAISARQKIDQARKETLRDIREGFIRSYFFQIPSEFKQEQKFQNCTVIIDSSDHCVLTSSFSTISDQQ